ncbi:hypothetical protein [Scytonema sp. PCC 10023]|uniref:hypothetical protein n=1 Tax=Scytonema sp. PCC 10023 TaxID=1680591 RepID=UPI0039C73C4A
MPAARGLGELSRCFVGIACPQDLRSRLLSGNRSAERGSAEFTVEASRRSPPAYLILLHSLLASCQVHP